MKNSVKTNKNCKGKALLSVLLGRGGATLVEMIVTFVLIAIFMLSATVMLSSALQVYSRIKEQAYAQNVFDVVFDRIESEVSPANQNDVNICGAGSTLSSGPDGKTVTFAEGEAFCCRNGDGVRVCVYASPEEVGGQLVIHYYGTNMGGAGQDSIDWTYDSSVMQGFEIQKLTFSKVNDHTICAELSIISGRTGNCFASSRVFSCVYLEENETYSVVDQAEIW